MKLRIKSLALAALLSIGNARAVTWLCSTGKVTRVAESGQNWELAGFDYNNNARQTASQLEIVQAYKGYPVLRDGAWVLAYMLPANHPDTKAAFLELGISPAEAQAMARNKTVDRGIRIVKTPEELVAMVAKNPPAIGYASFFVGAKDVAPCF